MLYKALIQRSVILTLVLALFFAGNFAGNVQAANSTESVSAAKLKANIVSEATKYLRTPYVFGASYGQTRTFDCSSFTKTVFANNGIDLPRISRSQSQEGVYVSRSNLEVGDLLFFSTPAREGMRGISEIGHVGIYIGDGQMIHTFGEGGVKYESIESGWWNDHYITARRVIR